MDYGFSLRGLLAATLFTAVLFGPVWFTAFMRRGWRGALLRSVLLLIVCAASAEGWATAQEQWFAWKCRKAPIVAAMEAR
jgi:hypothetical protein